MTEQILAVQKTQDCFAFANGPDYIIASGPFLLSLF